jgi:hypothetical protein
MNKILIIIIGLLASNASLAEFKMIWSEKKSGKEFTNFYIDLAEKKSNGNLVILPYYYNHDGTDIHPVMSSGGIAELNCKEKLGRSVYFTVFTDKDLGGQQLSGMEIPNEKWKVLGKANLPMDAMYKRVCTK